MTKTCKQCKRRFEPRKTFQKYCHNKCNQEAYRCRNKIQVLASSARWREKNKDKIKIRDMEYYLMNRDKCIKSRRLYKSLNKEKLQAKQNEWKRNNPDKVRAACIRQKETRQRWIENNRDKRRQIANRYSRKPTTRIMHRNSNWIRRYGVTGLQMMRLYDEIANRLGQRRI